MLSEKEYIELCKTEIEKKLRLDINNSASKTRDLTYLSGIIRNKSGVSISLSTLKRLWREKSTSLPQPATLNALASVLDYADWQEFKQENAVSSKSVNDKKSYNRSYRKALLFISSAAIILIFIILLINRKQGVNELTINNNIPFSANKTVSTGVPNTVLFKYNLSGVVADSFFIQQSWNPKNKVAIPKKDSVLSSIYYEPGFHRAKLIVNNTVVSRHNIHILSDGWQPYVVNNIMDDIPTYFEFEPHISEGHFQMEIKELAEKGIDVKKNFSLVLNNTRDYGVYDNNFSLHTIVKCDSVPSIICPSVIVVLVFEVHIFYVKLVKKGCEHYSVYKIGEVYAAGNNNDLSAQGCDIYNWQELELKVQDRQAEVFLNGRGIIQTGFTQDFGKLMSIVYKFEGLGSVDFLSVGNENGDVVFEDDME